MPHAHDLGRSARDARHGRWLLCGVLGAVVSAIRSVILRAHEIRRLLQGLPVLVVRPIRPQPMQDRSGMWAHATLGGCFAEHVFSGCLSVLVPCPFGAPGQRLWVQETYFESGRVWRSEDESGERDSHWAGSGRYLYAANSTIVESAQWRKFSSGAMPRRASRLTVEVESTRALRLHALSEGEFKATGVYPQFRVDLAEFCRGPIPASTYANGLRNADDDEPGWSERYPSAPRESNPFVWATLVRPVEARNG